MHASRVSHARLTTSHKYVKHACAMRRLIRSRAEIVCVRRPALLELPARPPPPHRAVHAF
eukprot:6183518-Pleurochrysis_carterae.AAC.1